jgi:hypothetical protein
MKNLFLALSLLILFVAAHAQEKMAGKRDYTIKLPLSCVVGDIYGESMGIGIGIEKMLKSSISISQEIGYIFHVDQVSLLSQDLESINGFKSTTEIRKYLNKREIPESGFFATIELKNIFTKSNQEARTAEGIMVENEISRYRSLLTTNLGVLFYWDKYKKSKITVELLGGGGLGYVHAGSSLNTDNLGIKSSYNSANDFYPMFNLDLKIGYILK